MPYDKNNGRGGDRYDSRPQRPRTGTRRAVPPAVRDDAFDGRRGRPSGERRGFDRDDRPRFSRDDRRPAYGQKTDNRPKNDRFSRDISGRFPKAEPKRRDFERRIPENRGFAPRHDAPRRPMDTPFGRPETDPLERMLEQPVSAEPENMLAGRNPIREAIKAGRDIEKLMVARGDLSGSAREIVAKAREAGVVVQEVDRTRLDALYKGHQGMIAFTSAASYSELDDVFAAAAERGEEPFVIVLDGITDPHNLGAIIRTAECAGAHGVIIPERRSVGLTPAAVKASAGACEYMKVVRVTNINRTLETLKDHGLWIVGATMDGDDALSADLTGPVALVIGAEGEGIAELTLKKCDLLLSLPMKGRIDSLNASVAAGVMMYAVVNARRG